MANTQRYKYLTLRQTARGLLAGGILNGNNISFSGQDDLGKIPKIKVMNPKLKEDSLTRTLLDDLLQQEDKWISLEVTKLPFSSAELMIMPKVNDSGMHRVATLYNGMPFLQAEAEILQFLRACTKAKSYETKIIVDLEEMITEESLDDEGYELIDEAM